MKKLIYFSFLLLFSINVIAQSVTIDPQANNSGIVNVQSTNKGVLVPNMTTAQRTAIAPAQKGLLVFDSNTSSFWFYNGVAWNELINNNSSYWSPTGTELSSTGFSNFNFSNGSAISALSTGFFPNGTDGTIRIYSSGNVLGRDFLTLDANSIQARNYNLFAGKAEIPLRINPFGGNVGVGLTTPTAKLHVGGNMKIDGTNVLEFGAGVAGKNANAGKIGYQTFGSNDALDIVGAGVTSNRKIKLWAENGVSLSNGLYSDQTANLNIVPIGIANFKKEFAFVSCIAFSSPIELNNIPSNLTQEETADTEWGTIDDKVWVQLKLNPALASQYSKVVAIGSTNFDGSTNIWLTGSGYINSIYSGINRITSIDQYYKTTVVVDDLPCGGSVIISGSVVFYGIK